MNVDQRICWVDTLKAIGMFFIVLGHYFPPHCSEWIYTFNVPLFFFISGFLSKREVSWSRFFAKCWRGLLLPYIIYCLLINIPYIVLNITDVERMSMMFLGWFFGSHSINGMTGCLNMWFVYCLFVVRLLYQLLKKGWMMYLFSGICICALAVYHESGLTWKNSFINVTYAYPYFMLGCLFKEYGVIPFLENLSKRKGAILVELIVLPIGILSKYNRIAYTYEGGVGNNLLIFVLLSILNICILVLLSMVVQQYKQSIMRVISQGSILILAFHLFLVSISKRIILHLIDGASIVADIAYIVLSCIICLFFVPIIRIVKKYAPILIGGR